MVEAQEYLNSNYPRDQRSSIVELDISRKELQGSLIIEGFANLQELNCSFNGWGDSEGITSLEIKADCLNLEIIKCQYNGITSLKNLQKFPKLKTLICNDNKLSELEGLSQKKNLEVLNLMNNEFSESDLSFLELLTGLKKLELGNGNSEKVELGTFNRFSGSLKYLAKMNELTALDIRNTNINSGLEHLPDSVKSFNCFQNLIPTAKVRTIYNYLVKSAGDVNKAGFIDNFSSKLQDYKREVIDKEKKVKKLEEENERLKRELATSEKELKKLQEENIGELKEKIRRKDEVIIALQKNKETTINKLRAEIAELTQGTLPEQSGKNIDKIIEEAKNAKTIEQLEKSTDLLNLYINSQQFKVIDEQKKQEIEQLRDLLAVRLKANKDIEKELNDDKSYALKQKDLISTYQDYPEQIWKSSNQQEIKNFVDVMINDYLPKQRKIYLELELSKTLKKAEETSDNFEEKRQARQFLENFVLKKENSLEMEQVYQVINKGERITKCIEGLVKWIVNDLNEYVRKSKDPNWEFFSDPDNEESIEGLKKGGYAKGTEKYNLYFWVKRVIERFSESRLDGIKFELYLEHRENIGASTSWKNNKTVGKVFVININLGNPEAALTLSLIQKYTDVAHELAHDVVMLKEFKGELRFSQAHSPDFWKAFYIDNNDSTTFAYMLSCLTTKEQKELKSMTNILKNPKVLDFVIVYCPLYGDYNGKRRISKHFEEGEIEDAKNYINDFVLRLHGHEREKMDDEYWEDMDKAMELWVKSISLNKLTIVPALQDEGSKKNKKHKVYILFDEEKAPKELKKSMEDEFKEEEGWKWEIVTQKKATRMFEKIDVGAVTHVDCGYQCDHDEQEEIRAVQVAAGKISFNNNG